MMLDHPAREQIPQLLALWKAAFGEYNGFWELFLETAFSPRRCRCVMEEGQIQAAACWLDCQWEGRKMAYLYAVVTHPDFRGRGLARRLLADIHDHLRREGYAAALLVPAEEGLREMYRRLGYRDWTTVAEFSCGAAAEPVSLRAIGPGEYAALRRKYLPEGGVVQEGENLAFLAGQAQFYAGEDVLLAAYTQEGVLHGMELLGDPAAAPAVVAALGCETGCFRGPGGEKQFAMLHGLTADVAAPGYFGFAFD